MEGLGVRWSHLDEGAQEFWRATPRKGLPSSILLEPPPPQTSGTWPPLHVRGRGCAEVCWPPPSFHTWGDQGSESLTGQPRSHELFQLLLRSQRLRPTALSEPGSGDPDNRGSARLQGMGSPHPLPLLLLATDGKWQPRKQRFPASQVGARRTDGQFIPPNLAPQTKETICVWLPDLFLRFPGR